MTAAAELIERIYEAALDPKGWAGGVQALEAALGGVVALSLRHPVPGDAGVIVAPSLDPDFVRSYQEHYFALDPLRLRAESAPVGRLVAAHRSLEDRDLRKTRFFQEWLEPQDLLPSPSLAGVVNRDEALGISLIAVLRARNTRRPSAAQQRLGARLMPHLRRAVRIHCRTAEAEWEARTLATAMDRMPVGLIVVDERLHVRATNRAAERILASRDALELNREGLRVVAEAEQNAQLQQLIAQATALGPREDASPVAALSLPSASGRRALQVLVTPVEPPEGGIERGMAVLFVCDSDQDLTLRPDLLRRLFDLTPAEAALARNLANGRSLEQSAQEMGIALGTARQRLQQIFAKTQTGRQSDLIRLLVTSPAQLLPED